MATNQPEKLTGTSLDIPAENRNRLKALFPSVFTETRNYQGELVESIDFEKLKAELGTFSDVFESRRERYGMDWPGKKEALRLIQTPSYATLKPCREESVNFDTTENLFIEGDNLEVLKLLQKSYYGKVKMIYIDPPYNTGKEFIYPDNYTESLETYLEYAGLIDGDGKKFSTNTANEGRFHTKWLNMMYPRLYLARNLLRDDGVIFISIDDNELNNLRKVCDEIFGEDNFVGILSVENNPKGRKNSDYISVSSEYLIIYAKIKNESYFIENVPKNANDMSEDEDGNYVHNSGKRVLVGENSFNNPVTNPLSDKNYSVYYRKKDKQITIKKENINDFDGELVSNGYIQYRSLNNGVLIENTYTEKKLIELYKDNALEFSEDKIYEKNFNDTIRIKSQLVNREYEAIIKGKKRNLVSN
jgi:adenine-specific DNA-methyltransferase